MKVDKYSNSLDAMAKKKGTGKYGKGDVPWYNQISPDDDLLVQQAKEGKLQGLWGDKKISDVTAANTIDPNAIDAANKKAASLATPPPQPVQQPQVVDNGDKLDKMIELLSGIGTALTVIAKAVTNGDNVSAPDTNTTNMLQRAFTGAQNSGFSDLFAGKDTNSIVSAMTALAQR